MRTSSNLDVVDEEHAGRLVAVVSFYFRRNHAVCLVIRRMIFLWSSSSSQLSYYLVRLRATVVLAAGAHVPVARASVVHDGGVDVFLNCTSRLDDDNVVLAGCELLEAFVHATFNPATLWQLACRVHGASACASSASCRQMGPSCCACAA